MISRCANTECSRPFHYFREGKLLSPAKFVRTVTNVGSPEFLITGGKRPGRSSFGCVRSVAIASRCICRRLNGIAQTVLEPLGGSRKHFRQHEEEIHDEAA